MSDTPGRGDIVWLTLNPRAGHERSGRRPVLVLSPRAYNAKRGLLIACPITSKIKGYPFEVNLGRRAGVTGVVLADHIRSFDFRARRAELIGSADKKSIDAVVRIVSALIGNA